jgi:hypothetical protein
MANDSDVLLKIYEEQMGRAKQNEEQRSTFANIILIVAAAVIAFINQKDINPQSLPLTIFLIVLGTYGVIMSEKLSEQTQSYFERARSIHKRLDELHPKIKLMHRREDADKKHNAKYRFWGKMHVHSLWLILHLSIILIGIILTIMALL